jgi:hypothetical protein
MTVAINAIDEVLRRALWVWPNDIYLVTKVDQKRDAHPPWWHLALPLAIVAAMAGVIDIWARPWWIAVLAAVGVGVYVTVRWRGSSQPYDRPS